jgi:alpha-glucosidase
MAKEAGLPDFDISILPGPEQVAHTPHPLDIRWDRDGVHDVHRRFRRTLDSYPGDRMAVGEAWVGDPDRLAAYVRPDELNLTFNFHLVEARWDAGAFRSAVERSLAALADVGAPCTWVLANHDVDRTVTRYGGGTRGVARARAAALVQLSLPGAAYVYNGDELGLPNVDLPDEALQDPTWERSGHADRGRDGERVPLPWSGTAPPFGFTTAAQSWLPIPGGWAGCTVAAQLADPSSTLHLYRETLRLRHELPDLHGDDLSWLAAPEGCLAYRRGGLSVWLNAGAAAVPMPAGEIVHASGPVGSELAPDAAVWVRS